MVQETQTQLLNTFFTFLEAHWSSALVVIAILSLFVQISPVKVYPLNWLIKLIRKFLKWVGHQINSELYAKIDKLETDFNEQTKQRDDDRIKDLRWQILRFGDEVKTQDFDHESFDHIYEIHTEYEDLLKKYGKKNGQVDRAMHRIDERYHQLEYNEDF